MEVEVTCPGQQYVDKFVGGTVKVLHHDDGRLTVVIVRDDTGHWLRRTCYAHGQWVSVEERR